MRIRRVFWDVLDHVPVFDNLATKQDGSAPATKQDGSSFLRRIPARVGADLRHIEGEDHYLRLHTILGSDLILLRLSDAIGRQVHRSHWVSQHTVAAIERNGHRTWLVLISGARIPVSRTYLPALRQAGWL
jgi:DNA-binding LytR/AlgR family response regulator